MALQEETHSLGVLTIANMVRMGRCMGAHGAAHGCAWGDAWGGAWVCIDTHGVAQARMGMGSEVPDAYFKCGLAQD